MFYVFILILLIPILAIFLDSDLGKALARRLERREVRDGRGADDKRLAYLESEVERLSADVERLDEESRFLNRLLEERSDAGALGGGARDGGARSGGTRDGETRGGGIGGASGGTIGSGYGPRGTRVVRRRDRTRGGADDR